MPQQQTVRVDDIEIAYEDHGSGDRAFVLVHGFTGSRDDWREVIPDLASRGRTIALDLRGHGGSSNTGRPGDYTLERLVGDLVGFLDAIGIERCDLLGHSMGGMIAMRLALAHADRLHSLVLMDTTPAPARTLPPETLQLAEHLARHEGMKALHVAQRALFESDPERKHRIRHLVAAVGEEPLWERTRAKLEAMDPEAFVTCLRLLADHEPVTDRLASIDLPTLVLVGEEDEPFLEPARRMATDLPDAEHVVIPRSAHSPQQANTTAWLDAVHAHLNRVRGRC